MQEICQVKDYVTAFYTKNGLQWIFIAKTMFRDSERQERQFKYEAIKPKNRKT